MGAYRTERDFLGEMQVPADAYYGIHTVRAANNFPVSQFRTPQEFIQALSEVKQACAFANIHANILDARIGEAIIEAAKEVQIG
ncbi:MAG: aspartate ammonia-lyase, partial [Dehalococcoidia bacterium]